MTKRNPRLSDGAAGKSLLHGATGKSAASCGKSDQQATTSNINHTRHAPTTNVGKALVAAGRATGVAKVHCIRKQVQALVRKRASPARLVKLNNMLSENQKKLVIEWSWGEMLPVKATSVPDLSMWFLSCFDPMRSEPFIPGRGSIPVYADSYHRVFGLPKKQPKFFLY